MIPLTVVLVVLVGCAWCVASDAASRVTRRRGLGAIGWFAVCLAFGPLAWVTYVVKQRRHEAGKDQSPLGRIDPRPDWDRLVQHEQARQGSDIVGSNR